jgi:predicted RNA-binding protein with PUA-like domain
MAHWLFKEEPDHYGFSDLERDGKTLWDGVGNNLARQNLRKVKRGDKILFYHTGQEKAVVGEMRAVSDAQPDAGSSDPKAVVVEVQAVRKLSPIPLQRIKEDPLLASWDLVRLPRLSVMPLNNNQWNQVMKLSRERKD